MLNKVIKIGIFDSGIGGLTVARAIKNLCPHSSLLYVGDTAHMPWGDKSRAHITLYSKKITEFLVQQGCQLIVVACNTASANSITDISKEFNNVKFFNVIDPIIAFLQKSQHASIGIIGTKQTIRSGAYQNKIALLLWPSSTTVKVLATPILVPLIEEGLIDHKATNLILEQYLAQLDLPDKSVLILGCTHYLLIKKNIEDYYVKIKRQIQIIDGSALVANEIRDFLLKNNHGMHFIESSNDYNVESNFYVTDDSEFFFQTANKFFANITLNFLPLWE